MLLVDALLGILMATGLFIAVPILSHLIVLIYQDVAALIR
jgi:hypothetical protein